MATAIALPLSAINLNGGILPPSAITEHAPRHGRSRRASVKGRGHSYNVVEDLDHQIVKALTFVLKRTVQESELEEDEETDNLIADAEGWVPVEDVVRALHALCFYARQTHPHTRVKIRSTDGQKKT